jgi:hypothetical protein
LPPEPTIRYPHPTRHKLAVSILAFNPDDDSSAKLLLKRVERPAFGCRGGIWEQVAGRALIKGAVGAAVRGQS